MPKAVQYDQYGGLDVLQVREVPRPVLAAGQVLVRVKAAGINPGEAIIRSGAMHERWPAKFPTGQGSDFAGIVEEVGSGATSFHAGDEVIGFSHDRSSQAELVAVEADHLTSKPAKVTWEQAGGLFVAGTTAYSCVRAVALKPGETVVVSGAAGGVGAIVVQLAKLAGAKVIGIAGPANQAWLSARGVTPVPYGDGLPERLKAAAGGAKIDAFIDTFGKGYVDIALGLGVSPQRINTIIDFAAVQQHKVKAEGSFESANAKVLAELAQDIAEGKLELPIAKTYPLAQVREAFAELEKRHTRGKIVLIP